MSVPGRPPARANGAPANDRGTVIAWQRWRGLLIDMDGVVLDSEPLHCRALCAALDEAAVALDLPGTLDGARAYEDWLRGRSRYDGMAALVAGLGLALPTGTPEDAPGAGSICGLANLKNEHFWSLVEDVGVPVLPGALDLLHAARDHGLRTALVSASRNATQLIARAGLASLFDAVIDGVTCEAEAIAAKPDPAPYRHAARCLGLEPSTCAAIEDSVVGVRSARGAGVAHVIGVAGARPEAEALRAAGAAVVVPTLRMLCPPPPATSGGRARQAGV